MRAAIRVLGATVRLWYAHLFSATLWSLLWAALSLTVVLWPPATAALHGVMRAIARGEPPTTADFTGAARRYAWVSFRWALLNALAGVVWAVNVAFYGGMRSVWAGAALTLLALASALWLGAQLYVWPLLLAQETPRLWPALRRALLMTLAAPRYTLILLVAAALASALSLATVIPLAIFWGGFLALLGQVAVRERLSVYAPHARP